MSKAKDKVDWKKEFRASGYINKIEQILDTYWDDDYKLFKIKKEIEKYRAVDK